MNSKKYNWIIGIDPGLTTGVSLYDNKKKELLTVASHPIHEAMQSIKFLFETSSKSIFVRVEDARKRKWFGNAGREQLQGAGSIKRDCKIWEDFLTGLKIDFEMVAPKNNKTKIHSDIFRKMTGWKGTTNEHGRDAAMLVFGR